ncbi:hypothetical protein [Motilibacter aurantiacus]|uniref:hypothetical protein n=1 Tax=Motilibacter aurantiacus TaxID=2714955 RepID=UPI00140C0C59|nr:hypothetical protein [Motilibacter aurantiacus]
MHAPPDPSPEPAARGRQRRVEVLHDGEWLPGTLLHAYRVGDRWRAVVRYYAGPGSQYQQARWAEDVRRPPAGA